MVNLDPVRLTRQRLYEYFTRAFKPRESWLVGMEVERMGRTAEGAPLPYSETEPSIRSALEWYHAHRGGRPVFEGANVIGLNGDWGNISLEPGGQYEWSSRPYSKLSELIAAHDEHAAAMTRLASELGVHWLDVAVDPELPLTAMPWMPKSRYNIMRPFLGARGRLAHRMMTQSAAIQVAFDYADEEDWRRKFLAAAYLAPIATALFGNSARVDGADSGHVCYRHVIWRHTDRDRCLLPDVVFEPNFGLARWLDWVLAVPTIFRHRAHGRVSTGGVPFSSLMELKGCDAVSDADWETHASTIFTEVRSYTYIEVRSADLQPPDRAASVPAFWAGILYDETALDRALELGERWSRAKAWDSAMAIAARDGFTGDDGGTSIGHLCRRALEISAAGLSAGAATVDDPAQAGALLDTLAAARQID